MHWTKERLSTLSPSERAQLYANAKRLGGGAGNALAKLIEEIGLPFSEERAVGMDDPLVLAMDAVIRSDEGRKACIDAVDRGLPAIAGVDPMLAAQFGTDYGKHNMTTHAAGRLVAAVLREMGYVMEGRMADTPKGCVARSGELWRKR